MEDLDLVNEDEEEEEEEEVVTPVVKKRKSLSGVKVDSVKKVKSETPISVEPVNKNNNCGKSPTFVNNDVVGDRADRFNAREEEKFKFLGKDRKDANKRSPGDENYDPRTLYLPPTFLKSLTGGQVANESSSVHNHGPSGNSTSTRASQNKKSAKAVTSPGPSNKITHLSSAEIQLRTKFLEEDSELMKLHQQFVKSGLMSDNEFWCIRKVKQRVGYCRQTLKGLKREDAPLLRKFGIQFKGGFENAEPDGNTNSCQRR